MISLQSSPVSVVRPIGVAGRTRGEWALSGLAGVSGSGTETVYTPYGYLVGNPSDDAGLFSVPGVQLYLESGGTVESHVEFWSDTGTGTGTGELSESEVGTLAASASALVQTGPVAYSLGSTGITTGAAGTYYSPWSVVGGTGISGVTFGIIQANSSLGATWAAYTGTHSFAGYITIELGDSGSGIISSYTLQSFAGVRGNLEPLGYGPANGSITDPIGNSFLVAAHDGNIYQCRLKLVINSLSDGYCGGGYAASYLAFR